MATGNSGLGSRGVFVRIRVASACSLDTSCSNSSFAVNMVDRDRFLGRCGIDSRVGERLALSVVGPPGFFALSLTIIKNADLYFLFLKTEIFVFHESLQKARYFAKIPALLAPLSEKLTKPLYTQDVLFSTSKCFFQNAASGFS